MTSQPRMSRLASDAPAAGRGAVDGGWARLGAALLTVTALLLFGCDRSSPTPSTRATLPSATSPSPQGKSNVEPGPRVRYPAVARIVAVGDLHGDLSATRAALRLARLIDDGDRWVGADAVLVQTGDILDRGDDERRIFELLEALGEQAAVAGGAVHVLNGNHELMNATGDLRYVTVGGMRDFGDAPAAASQSVLARAPANQRGRLYAFLPGGPWAQKLARHPVVLIVGDNVFVHGGVLPRYAAEVERINAEVASWLLGKSSRGAWVVQTSDSPVWSRDYSDEPSARSCKLLDQALTTLKARRMVVGHTVMPAIKSACAGKVWRIDSGLASHYGGPTEVLEIRADDVRPLRTQTEAADGADPRAPTSGG